MSLVYDIPKLTLRERVQNYNVSFPNRPDLFYDKGFIMGYWFIGSIYRNGTGYYGAYPYGLMDRMEKLFPDSKTTMHLFSGTLKADPPRILTYDIKPENKASICDNALNITKHESVFSVVDVVFADPPYEDSDFEMYEEEPFSKAEVMRQLGKVMRKGSHLCWLDLRYPMWSKRYWKIVGSIAVVVGANTRVRSWFIWEHI